ncbi:glycosyltransferase family 4 protein [Thalassotalea sp. PLHSN55]|uniref:glycosyltransferase family 4 protein n=1 Tax=Thalassotalea sp. PLHSN55 TaxID=3435888 RepID=UPI003F856C55
MKILVIPNRGRSYNAVRPEAECYIKLAQRGHQVTIMSSATNAYIDEYKKSGVTFIELKNLKKHSWTVIKQMRDYIKDNDIDLVYATESKGIPNASFACIGTKAKMIAYRGTSGGMYRTDPSNYLCMLHPRIDGVIGVSTPCTVNIKSKVRQAIKQNIETIYKGHDLDWYQAPAADLAELGSDEQYFNLLCVGSPRPHKGTHILLEAAKQLKDIENLRIILVGDNLQKQPFLDLIKDSGMAERILLPGFRNDVPAIAKACDLLVLPSLAKEGLTRTVLESLSNGTPVVSSANDGVLESIENDYNGFIVPIGDIDALAERIKFLVNSPDVLTKLSNNSKEIIKGKMSHQQTVEHMEAYFEKMIASA